MNDRSEVAIARIERTIVTDVTLMPAWEAMGPARRAIMLAAWVSILKGEMECGGDTQAYNGELQFGTWSSEPRRWMCLCEPPRSERLLASTTCSQCGARRPIGEPPKAGRL